MARPLALQTLAFAAQKTITLKHGYTGMLGYDDSKDGGLLSGVANAGRWEWLRASNKAKAALAGAILSLGGIVWMLMIAPGEQAGGSRPVATLAAAACATAWDQCGGKSFVGPSCCPEAHSCMWRSDDYSQCAPDCLCARTVARHTTQAWH
jgi:hypothetical protein